MIPTCTHPEVACVNHYELIRKYRCRSCAGVMMCSCDQEHGQRFLPHQLGHGTELETKREVPVTLGFQDRVCNECRGLRPVPAPVSEAPGRTSKISRYYWREISFETVRRFDESHAGQKRRDDPAEYAKIKKEVVEHFKALHLKQPKYIYREQSQQEVIDRTRTEVILIPARHVSTPGEKVQIEDNGVLVSAEEFAARYFCQRGYSCIHSESRPFHALFGVFMFSLIQDPHDPRNRMIAFGSRTAFDQKISPPPPIWTFLPEDFGAPGYFKRRRKAIDRHLSQLENLQWLFDYWTRHSTDFREYLWAHTPEVLATARQIMDVLGLHNLRTVLRYLVRDYWHNYCGWPDLFVYRDHDFFFVEVKSSKDKLSEDQKHWMIGNERHMKFGFKILKIGAPPKPRPAT